MKLNRYLNEGKEVTSLDVPGTLASWLDKNKKIKIFDHGNEYRLIMKKIDGIDLTALTFSGLLGIEWSNKGLVVRLKK